MHRFTRRPRRRPIMQLVAALSILLVASACGSEEPSSDPDTPDALDNSETDPQAGNEPEPEPEAEPNAEASTDPTPETAYPVTVGAGDAAVEIEDQPERIVSLSPTATEILFAIGAGAQVVAVDDQSDHPADAPTTDLSGFQPNIEAIAAHDPDLVIASGDPGDLVASLEALDIPVLLHASAATLEDVYAQIEQTGVASGHRDEATELVARMRSEIEAITDAVDHSAESLTYYHELDPNFYTVTSSTFIGELYGLVGLTSIADDAEEKNGGYPQLSPEYIVEANPDLIFLADAECCGVTPDDLGERPGWDTMTAVQEGAIIPLDEDVASRWGPRVVEFLGTIAEAVEQVEQVEPLEPAA